VEEKEKKGGEKAAGYSLRIVVRITLRRDIGGDGGELSVRILIIRKFNYFRKKMMKDRREEGKVDTL